MGVGTQRGNARGGRLTAETWDEKVAVTPPGPDPMGAGGSDGEAPGKATVARGRPGDWSDEQHDGGAGRLGAIACRWTAHDSLESGWCPGP